MSLSRAPRNSAKAPPSSSEWMEWKAGAYRRSTVATMVGPPGERRGGRRAGGSLRGPGVHGRGRELTGACKRRDVEFATLRPGTRPCRAGRGLDRPAFVRGQTEPRGPVLWSGLVPAGPLSMGTYALGSVFSPASVALVGGSPRERSLGRLVLRQLVEGGF